jgi:peroxiredoxin
MTQILSGLPIPDVQLGALENDAVVFLPARSLFAGRRAIVIGVPGAFTPVCTRQHVPDFVKNAGTLRASGFDFLACIAPNDPFVLKMWARDVDPQGKLRFLSDGNLDWTNALGLGSLERKLCLGQRSQRYMLVVENGQIARAKIEPSVLDFSCTGAQHVLPV